MRRGNMRNQRYGVASARGSKPVRAANRSPRGGGSASISRTSTSPSIMDTSRVWPSPSRAVRVAARFLPVGLSFGVATSSASPSQSNDNGTRYGAQSTEALATHTSTSWVSRCSVSRRRSSRERGSALIRSPRALLGAVRRAELRAGRLALCVERRVRLQGLDLALLVACLGGRLRLLCVREL